MGLKRWTGSGYADVNLALHRAAGQYVNRTPKAAYVWDGGQYKEVWPGSPYPATGTFNIVNGAGFVPYEVLSHTFVEPGSFTVTITVESGQTTLYEWVLNGEGGGGTAATTLTIPGLSVGDTITVLAVHTGTLNLSGTWSVVKN